MAMKIELNRRTFLQGMGVTMGLPLLEAMGGSSSSLLAATAGGEGAATAAAPTRMAFMFVPNGVIQKDWRPEGEGTNFEFAQTMKPLQAFKNDLNVFTNLCQDNGKAHGDGAGDHARASASYLTGAHPYKTSGADISNGISVDQVAALQVGNNTVLPSLEIGIEGGRNAGNCDSGYSCAYSSNISWKTPSLPVAKETQPSLVFDRLFGTNAKDRGKRDAARKSILDMVSDDARRLQQKLGQTDRQKVEEYFTSVRDLEKRIESRKKFNPVLPEGYTPPPSGRPTDKVDHIRQMYDLLALAFQTDATRISTYMLGNAGSGSSYPMVEVSEGHHQLSHHQNDEDKVAKLQRIDEFHINQFAYFLEKLKSIPEGEGTLLDNCMILYGSGLGDGNRHSHDNLPVILAGKAGGRIQTGRHQVYAENTPMNNLYLSMLDLVGADVTGVGDSNGRLEHLLA
ncbi:hypothetical protein Pla110_10980 [Polystyrenella longa]|uniref:DUF1552 domain-containing protein n=1 Tax=Polystyrenella longa TaxID=2528007 RepID=A0A518CJJ9_9PLAN|nr:DUF1552 domain-containing protein [Polystyrenella longa]QDU79390.1 hypothetical protein Pla110_10980 [Polystyrenella longa]